MSQLSPILDLNDELSPDVIGMLVNPNDPINSLRPLISALKAPMIETLLKDVDLKVHGSEILYLACAQGQHEIVKLLITKGVDVQMPPAKVTGDSTYLKSPFLFHAIKSGDLLSMEELLTAGARIQDLGFIAKSPEKKNLIRSNAFGCAAWYGKDKLLEILIQRFGSEYLNLKAIE